MTEETTLDRAHARMEAAGADDGPRRAFYERLAATELFLLLEREAADGEMTPALAPVEGVSYALAFDREDRLAGFAGTAAPYAALGGRALVAMLHEAGLGLALNPEAAPSAYLLPPDAVAWIAEATARAPAPATGRPVAVMPPGDVPEAWLEALDARLAAMAGLAKAAWLCRVDWNDAGRGHLVAFAGAPADAGAALARAVSDCTALVAPDMGEVAVLLLDRDDRLSERIARVGLRFDLPDAPAPAAPAPPGSDPNRPPRLR